MCFKKKEEIKLTHVRGAAVSSFLAEVTSLSKMARKTSG